MARKKCPNDSHNLLCGPKEAARLFGIKPRTFYNYKSQIIARHGLKTVRVGKREKYPLLEIYRIIDRCTDEQVPLYESNSFSLGRTDCGNKMSGRRKSNKSGEEVL
jgi:hypothetical protein